jgi:hypothetical protein
MARPRLLAVCVVLAILLAASAAEGSGLVRVTTGRWGGHAWTFFASDQVSGVNVNYCWRVAFTNGPGGSGGCSTYISQANSPLLPYYGMDVGEALGPCPGVDYVDGGVASTARTVEITLSTGAMVRTNTVAAPRGLAQSVRFFVARIPCGSQPETARGRTSSGKVVARYS